MNPRTFVSGFKLLSIAILTAIYDSKETTLENPIATQKTISKK